MSGNIIQLNEQFIHNELKTIVKNSVEDKRAMREAILPCIFKVIIMVAVLWLVY